MTEWLSRFLPTLLFLLSFPLWPFRPLWNPLTAGTAHAVEAPAEAPATEVRLDRTEKNTIFFKVPEGVQALSTLKTEFFDLKNHGSLKPAQGGLPWFLVSGRQCEDCSNRESFLLLLKPSPTAKTVQLVYPGKILDAKTKAVVLESRAFHGRCLSRVDGDVYVVFQKERVDRRNRMQSSVFVAEPGSDRVDERLIERNLPKLDDTLRFVRKKTCFEIDGRHRVMARRPPDLSQRASQRIEAAGDDDDEDDERDERDSPDSPEGSPEDSKGAPKPGNDAAKEVTPAR